jgi:hypothetical protein
VLWFIAAIPGFLAAELGVCHLLRLFSPVSVVDHRCPNHRLPSCTAVLRQFLDLLAHHYQFIDVTIVARLA